MKKDFFKIFVLLLTIPLAACAKEDAKPLFEEGKHYQKLTVKDETLSKEVLEDTAGDVKVIEFFSYGCGGCFMLEPKVQSWTQSQPDNIDFERMPVIFQQSWVGLAKAYYTAEYLSNIESVHPKIFDAIHQSGEITDSSKDTFKDFFAKHGTDEEDFEQAYNSFTVDRQFKKAIKLSQLYKITVIPSFVVHGKEGIYSTNIRMAGGVDEVFKVVEYLSEKGQSGS